MILSGAYDEGEIPANVSMGKVFCDKLKSFKDKVCLVNGESDEFLRCSEVLDRSIKFGNALKARGIARNDVVMVIGDGAIQLCIPFLACLYHGFIFVILNPDYTQYEISKAIALIQPKVIFRSDPVAGKLENTEVELIYSVADIDVWVKEQQPVDVDSYEPEMVDAHLQTAVIYFSSGTTGPPKGVQLTHSNLRMCAAQTGRNYFNIKESDVILYNLPCFNVVFLFPLCASLIGGARVVLLPKLKPEVFLSAIERTKPNKMIFVPLLVNFVLKSPLVSKYDLSSLQHIYCGSSPINVTTIEKFVAKFPNCVFHQIYGATETTLAILFNDMKDAVLGSVGQLMGNNLAKVVDAESGKILGPNEVGELRFKGPSITKGYYKNEAADKQNFDQEGFLRTGDVGYYDDRGFFYIVDRIKDIIKYKSYQVSPSEIESVLLLNQHVKEAAVVGVPDDRTGELPAAFVVKTGSTTEKELRDFVAGHLSSYKHLHGGLRFVDKIPRTALGKVDRKELKTIPWH